jgi:hypothetical protein
MSILDNTVERELAATLPKVTQNDNLGQWFITEMIVMKAELLRHPQLDPDHGLVIGLGRSLPGALNLG